MNIIARLFADPSKLIGIGMAGLGLAQMLLTNKQQSYERNAMKEELRKEILDDIKRESK